MKTSPGREKTLLLFAALTALTFLNPGQACAQTVQIDAKLLQQLQETVWQQQEQLKNQALTLSALQKQINDLKQATGDMQTQAAQAVSTARQAMDAGGKAGLTTMITTSGKPLKISLSGQVNRAVNQINDGAVNKAYFVDHATSGTRLNFEAAAKMDEDLTLGSRIEVAIAPENSAQVSQSNQTPGDFFNQRWAEVSLTSRNYGKLSIGKGDTASNTTAEADLSGTLAVQNSSVADIVNGMLFRERAGDHALTGIKVSTAFSNLDGLSRESRIRYDTPQFHGFSLAASGVSNQRADTAIFWDGKGYGFNAAARAAVANPNIAQAGNRYGGSFSILHENTGLNFTMAAGLQERDHQNNDTNLYGKLGWLSKLNRFGSTAFIVDYTRARNTPAAHDTGYATGVGVNQFFDKYDTELYLQYRLFSLERNSGPEVEDLKVGTFGARVRF